jgi:serpin B
MYVQRVVHEAVVSVDEKGTEAAAATGVEIEPTEVAAAAIRVDRPFFYALRDLPTGTILFAGRVTDPSAP